MRWIALLSAQLALVYLSGAVVALGMRPDRFELGDKSFYGLEIPYGLMKETRQPPPWPSLPLDECLFTKGTALSASPRPMNDEVRSLIREGVSPRKKIVLHFSIGDAEARLRVGAEFFYLSVKLWPPGWSVKGHFHYGYTEGRYAMELYSSGWSPPAFVRYLYPYLIEDPERYAQTVLVRVDPNGPNLVYTKMGHAGREIFKADGRVVTKERYRQLALEPLWDD